MNLSPSKIRTDGGTQPRAKLHADVIEDYAMLMRRGMRFPPLTVFFDGTNYWLADGFHRLHAWLKAHGRKPIAVEVIQGGKSEARWYSFGANLLNGLRRSTADKARAVKAALRHPQGAEKSDRQIAEHVGVHFETVAKYRKVLEQKGTIGRPDSRTGRDGRKINTANIGRKSDPVKLTHKPRRKVKPTRADLLRVAQPTLQPTPMEPMTSLCMPHNPEMGANTLIEVFDLDYIRQVAHFLNAYLEGANQCA